MIAGTACAVLALVTSAIAQGDIVLKASRSVTAGKWSVASDSRALGGVKVRHADGGSEKILTAAARPKDYFELTFTANAGVPYHLWLHGRADGDDWANDSVFVQFSGSVTESGGAIYRIGTTSATEVNLEECKGCGLKRGWAWQDNGWGRGVPGPHIYFAKTGPQTLRVQTREDGLSIDQIVLSPSTYLETRPPAQTAEGGPDGDTDSPGPNPTKTTLEVLHWNIHHGVGTDGDYDIDRVAGWIVKTGANVVSLNEVERYTGWGNEDQPASLASRLEAKTGETWHYNFAQRDGKSKGQGNLLLTTFAIESEDDYELSHSRSVARVAIIVNGIRVNLFSTHLDAGSSSRRISQIRELTSRADNDAEQRIILGDFNARSSSDEISLMKAGYADAWAVGQSLDLDVAYEGNPSGNTRNGRIDYAFYSKRAAHLKLRKAQVFDTRDRKGAMPSDHRPLLVTFDVK